MHSGTLRLSPVTPSPACYSRLEKLKSTHTQGFFLGSAIILQAMGAHSIALEMMDAMRDSRRCAAASRAARLRARSAGRGRVLEPATARSSQNSACRAGTWAPTLAAGCGRCCSRCRTRWR